MKGCEEAAMPPDSKDMTLLVMVTVVNGVVVSITT
jgi:hypothetical protein